MHSRRSNEIKNILIMQVNKNMTKTDINTMARLISQSHSILSRVATTSKEQDLVRRLNIMIKKLNKETNK